MRIGMVTTQFAEVGGVENVVRELTKRMREEHTVELVTRERPQNASEFTEFDEVHIIEDTDPYTDYMRKGREWFNENADEFDVLHFHNWSPILPARGIDTRKVLTFHGTSVDVALGDRDYLKVPVYWTLERYAASIADKVTSITDSHMDQIGIDDYSLVRNGVDTEKYRPAESGEKRQELREKHGVEGKGILIVAQHEPNKGHEKLIKACTELEEDYTLMMPSAGPLTEELEELSEDLDVKVEFYGKVLEDELVELYQAADLFCLPSKNEGLPLSMLEAMSSRLPVLVSDVSDNHDIVSQADAGRTLSVTRESLGHEIEEMFSTEMDSKGRNAREYAVENLGWKQIAGDYIQVYNGLR